MRFSQVAVLLLLVVCIAALAQSPFAFAQSTDVPHKNSGLSTQIRRWRVAEHTLILDGENPSQQRPATNDGAESKRRVEARILLPLEKAPASTLLFLSHLGCSFQSYAYLGEHWAEQGFACIFLFHADGVDRALEEQSLAERIQTFQHIAFHRTRHARSVEVLDSIAILKRWSSSPDHDLYRQFDWSRFGIAGHGLGADVAFEVLSGLHAINTDPPGTLCVLGPTPLSPDEQKQLSSIPCVPGLIVSGDLDESLIRRPDPLRRNHWFASYPECADRYELRFLDGKHFDFTGTPLRFGRPDRNPHYHRLIQAVTTSFFRTYLDASNEARKGLSEPEIPDAVRTTVRWDQRPSGKRGE